MSMPQLVMKKLDQKILKSNILKTRGFLQRKSMKKNQKWTYCFFYIDINLFAKEGKKILKSYRPESIPILDELIYNMPSMKRIRLDSNFNLLFVP